MGSGPGLIAGCEDRETIRYSCELHTRGLDCLKHIVGLPLVNNVQVVDAQAVAYLIFAIENDSMASEMVVSLITFLVFMNPFGLFIYLDPVMRDMSRKDFAVVLLKATVISFAIYYFHAVLGEPFFNRVLQIDFESFRMFGGTIIFLFAVVFIIGGKTSYLSYKADLNKLASEIALPFMVGAGTIALSIIIGNDFGAMHSFWMLIFVLAVTYFSVLFLQHLRDHMPNRIRSVFNNFMEVFLRINSFFMGAVGVDMFITGLNNTYFI